ncbi:MAG: alpha/beta hydrolase [Clostridia bacterium]|nr:alpha/beta hydrolase [Clostridia bacterium]
MYKVEVGQGENIVFLHGWGGNASAFLFVANKLKDRFRCTVFDMYGFGATPEPDVPLTVNDYATGVYNQLKNDGVENCIIVGHSFGGRVAIEIAAYHPEFVKSLVLVDSAGIKPKRGLKYYVKVFTHKILRKFGFSGLKGSKDYQMLSPTMKKTFINVVNYDQTPILKNIVCPTAIFWGRQDKVTPLYMAKTLHKGIKDSEIFYLDGGHFAYIQDERTFFAVLSAFLKNTTRNQISNKVDCL